MSSSTGAKMTPRGHVITALENAPKIRDPFPYFFAENVFPDDLYAEIQETLKYKRDFHSESFANRQFANEVGIPSLEFMHTKEFCLDCLYLFGDELQAEFGGTKTNFHRDLRLIRDCENYKIGPHTDAAWKVLSLLFYLPADDSLRNYGTSIFVPKDLKFRCIGGPHHSFDNFAEVWRAPFLPNSCLGFWKTDKSFHGVYPIPIPIERNVLLFNIYTSTDRAKPCP